MPNYFFISTETNMFSILHVGKNGEFLFWNGIHWQLDSGRHRYLDIEDVSKKYEWALNKFQIHHYRIETTQ